MIAVWLSAPPNTRRKAGDALRVHQRGVGRGQLVGEDDRALGHARIGGIGLLDQVADQPRADDADVLGARREIGVAHRGKAAGDLVDLELDRALGVDALPGRCARPRRAPGANSTASRHARRADSRSPRRRIRAGPRPWSSACAAASAMPRPPRRSARARPRSRSRECGSRGPGGRRFRPDKRGRWRCRATRRARTGAARVACPAVTVASVRSAASSILIELAFDQVGERADRRLGLRPAGGELDDVPGAAASIISPMIERPETSVPFFAHP